MLTNPSPVGLDTLLNALVVDASRTRTFIEQGALPYQMTDIEANVKVALTAINAKKSSLSQFQIQTILPGQTQVPISCISTKLKACPVNSKNLSIDVKNQTFQNNVLAIKLLTSLPNLPDVGPLSLEANLNRQLAQRLNKKNLAAETQIKIPIIQSDTQGVIHLELQVASSDQGDIKLPVVVSVLNQKHTFIFTTNF